MATPENLLTVFSAALEERDGTTVVEVPERELSLGDLSTGNAYRIAVLSPSRSRNTEAANQSPTSHQPLNSPSPPVEVGDIREVEIEEIGEQGDGLARVDRGYVVFVPDTDVGDRVTVEITKALENFGFADVIEGEPITG